MKVKKNLAAKMAKVGRTTFYRHLDEKGISVDADGRIDVSELIRVYGKDNLLTPEQAKLSRGTTKGTPEEHEGAQQNVQLLDEIKRLKNDLENLSIERKRERDQASEQIDHLKAALDKSMSQNDGLTRLLTDERTKDEKRTQEKEGEQANTLKQVLESLQALQAESQKKGWWPFKRKSA